MWGHSGLCTRIGHKYHAKWDVQVAEMIFQTCSKLYIVTLTKMLISDA